MLNHTNPMHTHELDDMHTYENGEGKNRINKTCQDRPPRGSVFAKLSSGSGESLTETLVAVLIVALASVLLVTMVLAARRVITRSGKAYASYISEHSALATDTADGSTGSGTGSTSDESSVTDNGKTDVVIKPADASKASDYSLPQIKESVTVREAEDGNLTFFPAEQG